MSDGVVLGGAGSVEPSSEVHKSCVASLNVLLFVDASGQPSVKVEHWGADPVALDLLARVLPGVSKYLDSKRGAIVRPASGIVVPGRN